MRSGLVAAGYKLQYHILIARPFFLAAMVMLACCVSLRFFRFGGITKMVLSGIAAGFLLYVVSVLVKAFGVAGFVPTVVAAWFPVVVAMFFGVTFLLYKEDG